MEFISTEIEGVVILQPRIYFDTRGYFAETFRQDDFDRNVCPIRFVQENESFSHGHVVRGLHLQLGEYSQAKLVRCIRGSILDVSVDLREGSPTFGKHVSVKLTADNHRMLFIPRGFAHGFALLSDEALFQYKCDNYYCPDSEAGINPFDPELAIDWHTDRSIAILSEKDMRRPNLSDIADEITYKIIK